jgi:predicted amidophosphoribosyltransferase
VPPGADVFQDAPTTETASAAPGTCQWCRAELPIRENLNFCPFCGTDLKLVPCSECGEELEPEWRFCIACGTEVTD